MKIFQPLKPYFVEEPRPRRSASTPRSTTTTETTIRLFSRSSQKYGRWINTGVPRSVGWYGTQCGV